MPDERAPRHAMPCVLEFESDDWFTIAEAREAMVRHWPEAVSLVATDESLVKALTLRAARGTILAAKLLDQLNGEVSGV